MSCLQRALNDAADQHSDWEQVHRAPCSEVAQVHVGPYTALRLVLRLHCIRTVGSQRMGCTYAQQSAGGDHVPAT
jgi:hypothetical protein